MSTAAAPTEPAADHVEDAADALLGGNPAAEMPAVDLQAVAAEQAKGKSAESVENQQVPAPTPAPAAQPATAPQPASRAVPMDKDGRTFDPLLHECTEDGQPVFRADGITLKCRRVPLKELKTTSKVQLGTPPPAAGEPAPAAPEPEPEPIDPEKVKRMREAGAKTCAGIQLLIMRKALGEHIGATESDQAALVECWTDMFEHYGMGKLHPVIGLAVVTGMITADGMREQETRNVLGRTWLRIKVAIGNLYLRITSRRAKAAEPAA